MAPDVSLYHAEAAYVDSSTGASVTLPCAVLYNANIPPNAALSASCELTLATTYTVSLLHSRTNPQHIGGSPHVLTIVPAATDPDSCAVEFPSGKSIVAGSRFEAVVIPFDEFKNPTAHAEDAFEGRVELGSSGDNVGDRHVLPTDHSFSELQTIAGTHKLYLYHTGTQNEVADSPISFDVIPAEPDAASSSHNIDFESFESRKSGAAELETRVMPLDMFNNTVPAAQGFAVTIDGGEPVSLVGPAFSYTYMVPAGLSKALKVSFTLDGEEISGSPVFIDVAPDNT
ncbi:hypothetical protein TeGR_g6611, partial [Tetraparma gracilis]